MSARLENKVEEPLNVSYTFFLILEMVNSVSELPVASPATYEASPMDMLVWEISSRDVLKLIDLHLSKKLLDLNCSVFLDDGSTVMINPPNMNNEWIELDQGAG
jgi:hypothetical protein